MKAQNTVKLTEMFRRFITNIADEEAGTWLIKRDKQAAAFLETQMDLLTKEERLSVYGFMEGMFPKHFKHILAARLQRETDPRCLEVLKAISALHSKADT